MMTQSLQVVANIAVSFTRICQVILLLAAVELVHAEEPFDLSRLTEGGYVVMLRHALAPGTGDPADFRPGDCSTQRNLSEEGRGQARRIGERFRAAGITEATVYSSQWCRCLETAQLLELGPVNELPALNSFYQRPQDREPNITALRAFLESLSVDGAPVILVTHQVMISAITGSGTLSGEAVILKLKQDGDVEVVGRSPG